VPNYIENQDALRSLGIEEVLVYCVNDSAVMLAWAKNQKIGLSMVKFYGDPAADLTKALEMEMTHPGPPSVGKSRREIFCGASIGVKSYRRAYMQFCFFLLETSAIQALSDGVSVTPYMLLMGKFV